MGYLFENDDTIVSQIITVEQFTPKDVPLGTNVFSSNLKTFELIYIISGEGWCNFDGKKLHDAPDTIRYIPKGRIDGAYSCFVNAETYCFDIFFDMSSEMPSEAMCFKNMGFLKNTFEQMYHIWNAKKPGWYAHCMSLLYRIIYLFREHITTYISDSKRAAFTSVNDYIIQNALSPDFNYSELPKISGYQYSYFIEQFKSIFGMTPVQYVTKLRIDHAKELLLTQHYNISEIAELCGFENIYYFSKTFKKNVGCPPKNFLHNLDGDI